MAAVKPKKLRHGHELTEPGRRPIVALVRARITVRSNPRVLVPVALAAALVVGAVLVAALVQIVVGLVALVLVGYFGYRLVRFVSKQLASYVAADADGVTICEYGEETHRHPWEQVTFAGHVLAADGSELLYVYVESADRLLTISPEFENFQPLRGELRRYLPATDLELAAGESLSDHLRRRLPDDDAPASDDCDDAG